jgi:hypothetical protein
MNVRRCPVSPPPDGDGGDAVIYRHHELSVFRSTSAIPQRLAHSDCSLNNMRTLLFCPPDEFRTSLRKT